MDALDMALRQWAEWAEEVSKAGWSSSVTLWRAMFGPGGGGFESQIPHGVEDVAQTQVVRRVNEALSALASMDNEAVDKAVFAAVACYAKPRHEVEALLGVSKAGLNNHRRAGEMLIRAAMHLRG